MISLPPSLFGGFQRISILPAFAPPEWDAISTAKSATGPGTVLTVVAVTAILTTIVSLSVPSDTLTVTT